MAVNFALTGYASHMDKSCRIDGCERPYYGRDLCNMHYQRWRAHGDPNIKLTLRDAPLRERLDASVDRSGGPDACHPWKRETSTGYGQIWFQRHSVPATWAEWYLATGEWPTQDVLHSCDNPPCCNIRHLSQGTHAENMRQMRERGRIIPVHGENHGRAKLTYDDVAEIRELRAKGWILKDLGERYGVSLTTVYRIVTREIWKT